MEDLLTQYKENTDEFIALIKSIPDEQFNLKPDEETWSVAENVEHIIRSEFGIPRLFNGPTKEDPDRKSSELISKMKTRFLNRDHKVKASGIILPTEGEKNKSDLIETFRKSRKKVNDLIPALNLDEVCELYKHPLYGFLTRKEWIHFNMAHTKRHAMQIAELMESFK